MKPLMAGVAGLMLLAAAARADTDGSGFTLNGSAEAGAAGVSMDPATLTWDESGSDLWDSPHWLGGPPDTPDAGTDAVLAATNPDTVTVGAAAEALSLTVNGGRVSVAGGDLSVGGMTRLGSGGTLTVNGGTMTTTSFENTAGGTFNHDDGMLTVHGGAYAPGTAALTVNGNTPTALPHLVLDGATPSGPFDALFIGYDAQGALTVTGGGQVATSGGAYVGYGAGSAGEVTVDGGGSTWTIDQYLVVGNTGSGTLAVTGGGQVATGSWGYVGYHVGSTSQATVDGGGSAWTIAGNLYLGGSESGAGGTGTLGVTGGGEVSVGGTLKLWPGGTVTLDGGTIATQAFNRTAGTFNWNAGTLRFTSNLLVDTGQGFGSTVTVPSGRNLEVADTLTVGSGGTVSLEGGTLTTTSLLNTVGGGVGHYDGTLTVRGGTYAPGKTDLMVNGNTPTALPHLVLDGATSGAFRDLTVGNDAQGALTVAGGTHISINRWPLVASYSGSTGEVHVDGSGSTFTTTSDLYVGLSGLGALAITGGGQASAGGVAFVAYDFGSTGQVTVDGSGSTFTTTSELYVGCYGAGTLTITGGGQVVTGASGEMGGTTGDATVDGGGSMWTITNDLVVGSSGAGTLTVTGGGQVATGGRGFVGYWDGGTGEVTVDGSGSMWSTSDKLVVGATGAAGTLAVTGGGQVATGGSGYVGRNTDSTGEVTVDGTDSGWTITGSLYVGGSDSAVGGPGTLTVRNEGLVSVGDTLGLWPTGTLVVDGGTVTAGGLAGPAGAMVDLRDPADGTALTVGSAASDTFSGTIMDVTGPGSLTKIGTGTQTLGGAGIAYTGATTVLEGILKLSDTTAFASDILNGATTEFEVTAGTWTFDGALGGAGTFVKSGDGTLVIAGPQDYDPGALFDVLGGALVLNTDAGSAGADLSVSVTDAELYFGADQHLDTLTIGDDGKVVFAGAQVVVLEHLVIGGMDLGATTLTPEPATLALVAAGGAILALRRRRRA